MASSPTISAADGTARFNANITATDSTDGIVTVDADLKVTGQLILDSDIVVTGTGVYDRILVTNGGDSDFPIDDAPDYDKTTLRVGTSPLAGAITAVFADSAGNETVRIAGDGKVGIGTTDPTTNLDIVSSSGVCNVKIAAEDGSNAFFQMLSDGTNHINFRTFTDNILLSQIRAQSTDESLRLRTGGNTVDGLTDRLVIDANGNVGIGTGGTVNYKLEVNGSLAATGATFTGLSTQASEGTALVINGSNVVGTRELGSNAFNSTAYLTGNQTITLSGDVTGSGTTAITCTVVDDSHTHDTQYTGVQPTARGMGWEGTYAAVNATVAENAVTWDNTEKCLAIKSDQGDLALGAAYRAVYAEAGSTVKWTVTLKGSAADADGLYLRLYGYSGTSLPDGKTHVSNSSADGSPFVVEETAGNQDITWYENGAVPSAWTTFERSWTVPATGYYSLVILNWVGFSGTIYVRQPDVSLVKPATAINQSGGTVSATTGSFSGTVSISGSSNLDMLGAAPATDARYLYLPRGGGITLYGSSAINHGIFSRDTTGAVSDDVRINSYGGVSIILDTNNNNSSGADFHIGRHSTNAADLGFVVSGETYDVTTEGNLTAYGAVSDIRYKENIEKIDSPVERLQKINGVTFKYKEKDDRLMGVIAQELLEDDILKLTVYENETVQTKEKRYAVRYEHLTAILIEAIKEQQQQIDELKEMMK